MKTLRNKVLYASRDKGMSELIDRAMETDDIEEYRKTMSEIKQKAHDKAILEDAILELELEKKFKIGIIAGCIVTVLAIKVLENK